MQAEFSPRPDRLELEQTIEQQITWRTWGRVRQLRVEVAADCVIIHGIALSYYVKQLALQGVMDVLRALEPLAVVMNVEVCSAPPVRGRD